MAYSKFSPAFGMDEILVKIFPEMFGTDEFGFAELLISDFPISYEAIDTPILNAEFFGGLAYRKQSKRKN